MHLFRRLLGLENEDGDEEVDNDNEPTQPEVSSIAPCVGLCHVERVQELEKDTNLKQLEKEPNECVGLCFIYRYRSHKLTNLPRIFNISTNSSLS